MVARRWWLRSPQIWNSKALLRDVTGAHPIGPKPTCLRRSRKFQHKRGDGQRGTNGDLGPVFLSLPFLSLLPRYKGAELIVGERR